MSTSAPFSSPDSPQRPLFDSPEPAVAAIPPGNAAPSFGQPRMKSPQRDQWEYIQSRLDDLVPSDSSVRAVWEIIVNSDLSDLFAAIQAVEGERDAMRLIPGS
jgi:hypothetical protein